MLCSNTVLSGSGHCVDTQRQWQVGFQNLRDKVKVSHKHITDLFVCYVLSSDLCSSHFSLVNFGIPLTLLL